MENWGDIRKSRKEVDGGTWEEEQERRDDGKEGREMRNDLLLFGQFKTNETQHYQFKWRDDRRVGRQRGKRDKSSDTSF